MVVITSCTISKNTKKFPSCQKINQQYRLWFVPLSLQKIIFSLFSCTLPCDPLIKTIRYSQLKISYLKTSFSPLYRSGNQSSLQQLLLP